MRLTIAILLAFIAVEGCATDRPEAIVLFGHTTTNTPQMRTNLFDSASYSYLVRAGVDQNIGAREAIERFVKKGKSAGWWSRLYAFYPLLGTTSNSQSFNLVSTNFTITFNGTNVFDTNGLTTDGVSAFGNTHFNWKSNAVSTNSLGLFAFYATNCYIGPESNINHMRLIAANDIQTEFVIGVKLARNYRVRFNQYSSNTDEYVTGNVLGGHWGALIGQVQYGTNISGVTSTNSGTLGKLLPIPPPINSDVFIGACPTNLNEPVHSSYVSGTIRAAGITKYMPLALATNFLEAVNELQLRLGRYRPNNP